MRTAIYTRVSTADQHTANQLEQLRAWCAAQGWTIVTEYEEQASGGRGDRAELRRMLDDGRRRRFDVLVFWSLDRLSREGALKTLQYLHQLSSYGVKWRSLQEPYIDSLGPFGDAIVSLIATIAQIERDRLRERTRAGLERARREGKQLGRPRRIVNIDRLIELRQQGLPMRTIAAQTDLALGTVAARLKGAHEHLSGTR